jgi:hypothetical protein
MSKLRIRNGHMFSGGRAVWSAFSRGVIRKNMKHLFSKEFEPGEVVPWWYGCSWYNYDRRTFTTHPVPFNLVARWTRELWIYLARTPPIEKWDEMYCRGYAEGKAYWEPAERQKQVWRNEGQRQCLEKLRNAIEIQESPCLCSNMLRCDCDIRRYHNIAKRHMLTLLDGFTS